MDSNAALRYMLQDTHEFIVIIDEEGKIQELSQSYAEFLHIDREAALGRHVKDIIENTRMHKVLETGKPEYADAHEIMGQTMIASRIPIIEDGKILGAFGRVLFPNVDDLYHMASRFNAMEQELSFYKNKYGKINVAKYTVEDIIGNSQEMQATRENILRVAKGNSNVLITGESGTGKELVAHAIHAASRRKEKPLICLNCAAIPAELVESELFGYEEGSFTGAKKGGKPGLFQAANRGTLFLDEIGDLPMNMQVKLLRAIQDKEVRRVGASVAEPVDVRIVAATNKNLYDAMENGSFRTDLFYRLNVVNIMIPPLRLRREDIVPLSEYFIRKIAARDRLNLRKISTAAMEYLKNYSWPGNIRELENILESASNYIDEDGIIKPKHLPAKLTGSNAPAPGRELKQIMEDAERIALVNAMLQWGGKKTKVAKELGISRTSLYEKLEKYNIVLD